MIRLDWHHFGVDFARFNRAAPTRRAHAQRKSKCALSVCCISSWSKRQSLPPRFVSLSLCTRAWPGSTILYRPGVWLYGHPYRVVHTRCLTFVAGTTGNYYLITSSARSVIIYIGTLCVCLPTPVYLSWLLELSPLEDRLQLALITIEWPSRPVQWSYNYNSMAYTTAAQSRRVGASDAQITSKTNTER